MQPLGNRVVCDVDAPPETTKGGLYVPDNQLVGKPWTGTALAVGPGLKDEIAVGDKVTWPFFAGVKVEKDGALRMILREDEIIGTEKV